MNDIRPLKQVGLTRANPDAREGNHLRLSKESCQVPDSACIDRGDQTLADSVTVTGIETTVGNFTFDAAILVTETEAIKIAIGKILDKYEVDPYISVDYAGGDLIFTHVGDVTVSKVTTSGTDLTTARQCETEVVCDYLFSFKGALVINGTTAANSPWDPGDVGAVAEIKASVEALLDDSVATVTEDLIADLFYVEVVAPKGTEVQVNGEGVPSLNCLQRFKA